MKRTPLCLLLVCCPFLVNPCLAADPVPASAEKAELATNKWLDGLGMKGLVIEQTVEGNGFVGQKIVGRESYMYVLSQEGWYVNLGFAGKVEKTTPLETLKAKFKYVALNRVPTPGLAVPGWDIRPRTPVSSFKDGVEFVSYKDGLLTVKVNTKFFALYGRDPKVLFPQDRAAPKGSYFQIRKNFPLDLTLTAPVTLK